MDNQTYIDTGSPPAEVLHFVNNLSAPKPQSYAQTYPCVGESVRPVVHSTLAPLLLLRLLNYLKTVEGRAWISTLSLPEQSAYTGVRASLERVLAVGYIIGKIA